ncbi:hypothetical protein Sjap_008224 [Stephania japonica]|uniref:Uncharacterized protein n=1 Tax=Stephania japonica TaxID=461633 RepID=A0AAP0JPX4_9MAGN
MHAIIRQAGMIAESSEREVAYGFNSNSSSAIRLQQATTSYTKLLSFTWTGLLHPHPKALRELIYTEKEKETEK